MKEGQISNGFEFELFEKYKEGEVAVTYMGMWFMVDNDYLSSSCTVPPDNDAETYEAIHFS